jgi:proteasome lid subunit RPN8/RPN11
VFASRHANEKIEADKQREVYGILIGNVNETTREVRVNQAIGILAGERTAVEFESKQYVDLSNIDESIWKQSVEYERGDFICGWWHSHPGFGLFYSQTDITNHLGFQSANPFAIGIVYDYKLRKTALQDPGIDVFTLEDPKLGQRSSYEKVDFEIVEIQHALDHIDHGLSDILKTTGQKTRLIQKITDDLQKKQLAQLQRNYGLLLLKKTRSSKQQKALADEDDPGLYEWNEEELKKKYEIPKYRKNIELQIAKAMKIKTNRKTAQELILKELKKPYDIIKTIKQQFDEISEEITTIRRWLDAEERLKIKNFHERIDQYINVLNALLSKAFYLDPREELKQSGLFDATALEKQFYGQEEEILQEQPKMLPRISIPTQPTTIKIQTNKLKEIQNPVINPSSVKETAPFVKVSINKMQPIKIPVTPPPTEKADEPEAFPLLPVKPTKKTFQIELDELFEDDPHSKSTNDGWD